MGARCAQRSVRDRYGPHIIVVLVTLPLWKMLVRLGPLWV